MTIRASLCMVVLIAAANAAADEPLHSPVHILTAGKPLDVQREGHAAPFVGDFDGDGSRDLLVGQYHAGRLRIYRNAGTNAAPLFEDFTWLKAASEPASVPTECCVGFTPQLIDLDGDQLADILSGSFPGEVYFFRRQRDGTFAAGQPLVDSAGKPLNFGHAVTAFAVDWDASGSLDLLLGNIQGEVLLARRAGSALAFEQPEKLSAGGEASSRRAAIPRRSPPTGTPTGGSIWWSATGTARFTGIGTSALRPSRNWTPRGNSSARAPSAGRRMTRRAARASGACG
jgi:hypothetical protein